jgi:cephalosporin hydroxylase
MSGLIARVVNRILGRRAYADPARNRICTELEVDKWTTSAIVLDRLIPAVGVHPFPLDELMLMVAAVSWARPTHVFEWGTHIGKSARVFYEASRAIETPCEIHSVDLPADVPHVEHPGSERGRLVRGLAGITLHLGDGIDTALRIHAGIPGVSRCLFLLDGDHEYATVARELQAIEKNVPGATILVHDAFYQSPESRYNVGPWKAVEELLARSAGRYGAVTAGAGLPGMTLLFERRRA